MLGIGSPVLRVVHWYRYKTCRYSGVWEKWDNLDKKIAFTVKMTDIIKKIGINGDL